MSLERGPAQWWHLFGSSGAACSAMARPRGWDGSGGREGKLRASLTCRRSRRKQNRTGSFVKTLRFWSGHRSRPIRSPLSSPPRRGGWAAGPEGQNEAGAVVDSNQFEPVDTVKHCFKKCVEVFKFEIQILFANLDGRFTYANSIQQSAIDGSRCVEQSFIS
jgi:hypothetical protein